MPRPILAAMASIPGRPLEATLRSLVGQVDQLAVALNGYDAVPDFVHDLDCWVLHDGVDRGAEGKLAFADRWDGVYLACDDDFEYGPTYAEDQAAAVEQWNGAALVSMHGRIYTGRPASWKDWGWRTTWRHTLHEGKWINYLGTGVMAFDSGRLAMPTTFPVRNACDPQVSVWAQEHGVPIWCRPHRKRELRLMQRHDADTIFNREAREGFVTRQRLIDARTAVAPWRVLMPEDPRAFAEQLT